MKFDRSVKEKRQRSNLFTHSALSNVDVDLSLCSSKAQDSMERCKVQMVERAFELSTRYCSEEKECLLKEFFPRDSNVSLRED